MIITLRDRRELFQIDYTIVPAQVIMVDVEAKTIFIKLVLGHIRKSARLSLDINLF